MAARMIEFGLKANLYENIEADTARGDNKQAAIHVGARLRLLVGSREVSSTEIRHWNETPVADPVGARTPVTHCG